MSGLGLWKNGEPTTWGVEVFMFGECWTLAYYIHRLTGFPVYLVHHRGDVATWEHVVVKIGHNQYLDVNGIRSRKDTLTPWSEFHTLTKAGDSFASWDEYFQELGGCHQYLKPHERSRAMAKRLVEKYVQMETIAVR